MNLPAKRAPAFAPRPNTVIGYCDGKPVQIDQNLARYLDEILIDRINLANAPLATVLPYAGSAEPTGWLICNGQSVSTRTYADLFAVIGYTYGGSGDSFNVPDYRGKHLVGAGDLVGLGEEIGSDEITLTQANLPAYNLTVTDPGHGHDVTDPGHSHGVTDPEHNHGITDPQHSHGGVADVSGLAGAAAGADVAIPVAGSTDSASTGVTVDNAATGITIDDEVTGVTVDSGTTGISVSSGGGGEAFSNHPPSIGANYIIKA